MDETPKRRRPHGSGSVMWNKQKGSWEVAIYVGEKRLRRLIPDPSHADAVIATLLDENRMEIGPGYMRHLEGGWWPRLPAAKRSVTQRVRWAVLERDGFKCVYCGATAADGRLVVDHVVAVARGGSNDMDNLVTACQPCNAGKGASTLRKHPAA